MKKCSILFPIVLMLMLGLCSGASAAIVFNNLGQTARAEASLAQYGGQLDVNASDFLTGGFTITITSATFSFGNMDDIDHVMTPSIYTDNGGTPGTLVGSLSTFNVPLSASPGTTTFANYTSTSAGISLAANTTYWMAVSVDQATDLPFPVIWNSTASNSTDVGSTFSTVSATQIKYSDNGGSSYSQFQAGNTLFSLSGSTGSVPEPSRMLLLLGGFCVTLLRRRRATPS